MFISTFVFIATIISSLFAFTSAAPIIGRLVTPEPLSLLGRHYRDVRIRHTSPADLSSRRSDDVNQALEGNGHTTWAERLHRKSTAIGTHDEQLQDHTTNFLSNQYPDPSPADQTPIPVSPPSPGQITPDMSIPRARNPAPRPSRLRVKHLKGNSGRKVVKT
jgi:hypothetical protein